MSFEPNTQGERVHRTASSTRSSETHVQPTQSKSKTGKSHDGIRTVGLFDPLWAEERKNYFKSVALGLLLTSIFMWIGLSIYWGSYHEQPQQLHRLTIGLIDLDSPACAVAGQTAAVGPAMLEQASSTTEKYHLGWRVLDSTIYDLSGGVGGSPRGVDAFEWSREAVHDQDYYGIIIVNANATLAPINALTTLLSGGSSSYMGTGAMTLVYGEARNFETYDQWIAPGMTRFASQVQSRAATTFVQNQLSRLSGATNFADVNKTAAAEVLASPFGFSTWNINPFDEFAGIPATTVGQIYLLIFTYFVSLFWMNVRAPYESKFSTIPLLLLRIGVPVLQYFFISLSISLISLAFYVTFNNYYTRGGFVLFWIMNFLSQWGLGTMMEVSLAILGPRFTAFFLVIWVLLNVSTVFMDLSDMNHVYAYGFGLPVYNSVDAAKSIIFGTKNHLVQNYAVNLAWCFLGSLLLAIVILLQRRSATNKARKGKSQ